MDNKLAMKIYNMMCDTDALKKGTQVGKKTDSFSYKAIGEADVLNVVKPLLKKYQLIVFPIDVTAVQINKITQLTAKFKIVDAETGEEEILAAPGNGADSQDKGSGKAWTYLYKALFQKTLCLFSGEDTDSTHSKDLDEQFKPIPCTDLIEIGHKKGYSAKAIEASLVKDYSHGMEFISKKEHDEVLAKLTALPDKE